MLLKAIFSDNSKPQQQKEEDHWPPLMKMELENSNEDFLANSIRYK
jgi:hypothetical protein